MPQVILSVFSENEPSEEILVSHNFPYSEVIEKELIQEEVKIDPFTEAEVLNATSSIKEETIDDAEPQVKEQEGIIKRFSAKALFGNSSKKNNDIKPPVDTQKENTKVVEIKSERKENTSH